MSTAEKINQALAEIPVGSSFAPVQGPPQLRPVPSSLRPIGSPPVRPAAISERIESRDRELAEQQQVDRAKRYAERQAKAEAELNTRLCKDEHKPMKNAALAAKTLCALLLGPTGCGKSSAARYLTRHARPYWLRAIDLATAERRHGLGEGLPPEIERARSARSLVIDDVGHEKDTAALFDVLDHRDAAGLPTIITSGLTKDELSAHISAATVRRIIEQHCRDMKVLVVDCHGEKTK